MKIPKLSTSSLNSIQKILNASNKKITQGQQVILTDYYAFLHSPRNLTNDVTNFAKTLILK